MHRNIDHDATPNGRTAVQFVFAVVPADTRAWWLVITPDAADVCDDDPCHAVSVTVHTGLRPMTEIWHGALAWSDALRSGALEVLGPAGLRRALPLWFKLSAFAAVQRARPDRSECRAPSCADARLAATRRAAAHSCMITERS
ncbi:MAG: hypothetical protein ABJA34_00840 [Pseudonocardiales bacterium]